MAWIELGDSLDPLRVALAAASAACALAYLLRGLAPNFAYWRWIKGGAAGFLVPLPLLAAGHQSWHLTPLVALTLSLLISVLGDILLVGMLEEKEFGQGLSAFFCARLALILAFTGFLEPSALDAPAERWALVLLAITAVLAFLWVAPKIEELALLAGGYIAVVACTFAGALIGEFGGNAVLIGAALLVLADLAVAYERFKGRFPGIELVMWAAYYAGQITLTLGIIHAAQVLS